MAVGNEYYCKCKKCKYIDPTETSGYKWYCEYYKTYEHPDEVKECRHYCERGGRTARKFAPL